MVTFRVPRVEIPSKFQCISQCVQAVECPEKTELKQNARKTWFLLYQRDQMKCRLCQSSSWAVLFPQPPAPHFPTWPTTWFQTSFKVGSWKTRHSFWCHSPWSRLCHLSTTGNSPLFAVEFQNACLLLDRRSCTTERVWRHGGAECPTGSGTWNSAELSRCRATDLHRCLLMTWWPTPHWPEMIRRQEQNALLQELICLFKLLHFIFNKSCFCVVLCWFVLESLWRCSRCRHPTELPTAVQTPPQLHCQHMIMTSCVTEKPSFQRINFHCRPWSKNQRKVPQLVIWQTPLAPPCRMTPSC